MKPMVMLAGIVCVVFIAGCGNGGSPSSSARKFLASVEKNDAKTMETVATPETVEMMAVFNEKEKGMLATLGEIESTTEEIDGDTAVVTVFFEKGEKIDLDLIKVKGKWKVTINSEK